MVERLDGFARITLEELAITHFVKSGTLQNAFSTRPRVVVGLEKSAHMHIVRLKNSQAKGLKRMVTKSAVAMLKKHEQLYRTEMEPPKSLSILRKSSNKRKPIRCVKYRKAVVRHGDS